MRHSRLSKMRQTLGAAVLLSVFVLVGASPSYGATTICRYTWSSGATGWRTHTWQASDCSNGLPTANQAWIAQGENGVGTSGQVTCTATSGSHYNHPAKVGAASGTVRCLYLDPAETQATVCTYAWSAYQTGWRTHPWQGGDCSNGLPQSSWKGVGQGQNGVGMAGMADCTYTTQGSHYNHPTYDGPTNTILKCLYVAPSHPSMTKCNYGWTSYASGWRTRTWQSGDCSNGMPSANAWSVGNTRNGAGAGFMAGCTSTTGSHYNHPTMAGATNGFVDCAYLSPAPPPPPPPAAPPRDAIRQVSGSFLPVYEVAGGGAVTHVGFQRAGDTVHAYDQDENQIWSTTATGGSLSGGFDFDADGWPDIAYIYTTPSPQMCGTHVMNYTSIRFLAGRTGQLYSPTAPLLDICWEFPGTPPYPTSQWTTLGVLFGAMSSKLGIFPYYATTAWFFGFSGGSFVSDGSLYYPSTSAYDSLYTNDQPNPWHGGPSYLANSHIANGLLVAVGGVVKAILFTSGRAVVYNYGLLGPTQLGADRPYVTGGRTDLAGRNYGVMTVDPGQPNNVVLVSGADTYTVFRDLQKGYVDLTQVSGVNAPLDPWGSIERHLSIYSLSNNTVADRFYSYAHDNNDGHRYENRVVYPANPLVPVAGSASRIAYNVYGAGHWALHVSVPGGTADTRIVNDLFLWDIADVDNDGTEELIASPTRWDSAMGNYYFPDWETRVYRWDEGSANLVLEQTFSGVIPHLTATFRKTDRTTTKQWLYPVLRTLVAGAPHIVVSNSSWQTSEVAP